MRKYRVILVGVAVGIVAVIGEKFFGLPARFYLSYALGFGALWALRRQGDSQDWDAVARTFALLAIAAAIIAK